MPITKIPKTRAAEEDSSYNIKFDVHKVNEDGTTSALIPDSVKVYVMLPDASPTVYINDRDGTTNTDGLDVTDSRVLMHFSAADNVITARATHAIDGFEFHLVRFEIAYNGGTDKHYEEFLLPVKDLHAIS
jgi:hypothetical protein